MFYLLVFVICSFGSALVFADLASEGELRDMLVSVCDYTASEFMLKTTETTRATVTLLLDKKR